MSTDTIIDANVLDVLKSTESLLEAIIKGYPRTDITHEAFRVQSTHWAEEILPDLRAVLGRATHRTSAAAPLDGRVRRLALAARAVAFEDQSPTALRELDLASEAFAEDVDWEDQDDASAQL